MRPAETDVLILAGGLGTRLRPVVPDLPKPLAEVDKRPFVQHLIEVVEAYRFRSITLCTGYKSGSFNTIIKERNGEIEFSVEDEPLGTGGALRLAFDRRISRKLPYSDPALVMNGDSICDANLGRFINWFGSTNFTVGLVTMRSDDPSKSGSIEIDHDNRVVRYNEKPETAGSSWINAGVYCIQHEVFELIPAGLNVSLEREIFQTLSKEQLGAWTECETLIDIGTPDNYHLAQSVVPSILKRVVDFKN
jgi:D-glycero-alpha-D-manno-heptose 1-phosphate guanylyltransferase